MNSLILGSLVPAVLGLFLVATVLGAEQSSGEIVNHVDDEQRFYWTVQFSIESGMTVPKSSGANKDIRELG